MFWKFYKLGGVKAFRKGGKPLLGEQIVEAGGQIGLKVAGIADEKLNGNIQQENDEEQEADRRALLK